MKIEELKAGPGRESEQPDVHIFNFSVFNFNGQFSKMEQLKIEELKVSPGRKPAQPR